MTMSSERGTSPAVLAAVKIFCGAVYVTALLSIMGFVAPYSPTLAWAAPRLAASLLGFHVLEALVFMKYVMASDNGHPLENMFWTVLWGFGHWKGLADLAEHRRR